jgi:hypothetical protein
MSFRRQKASAVIVGQIQRRHGNAGPCLDRQAATAEHMATPLLPGRRLIPRRAA